MSEFYNSRIRIQKYSSIHRDADCQGRSLFVEKNNSGTLGPGPVNLTDYSFDNVASSFTCL